MKEIDYRCPCDRKVALRRTETGFVCCRDKCVHSSVTHQFSEVKGIPVLISEEMTDTVCTTGSSVSYIKRPKTSYLRQLWNKLNESQVTVENASYFLREIFKLNSRPKILVVGSGLPGSGLQQIWSCTDVEIHGFDIYASDTTDFVADAHYIPLGSQLYDAVIIQAVLEHVVDPHKVVEEIYRVLKPNGLVYAETPFMQQVHEGAYDFCRFTVTGHRYLFKNFTLIRLGGNGNADLVLSWSIRYFVLSLTRSKLISKVSGIICMLCLMPFRKILDKNILFDGSSGVFFLGRKGDVSYRVSQKDIVALYKGVSRH